MYNCRQNSPANCNYSTRAGPPKLITYQISTIMQVEKESLSQQNIHLYSIIQKIIVLVMLNHSKLFSFNYVFLSKDLSLTNFFGFLGTINYVGITN